MKTYRIFLLWICLVCVSPAWAAIPRTSYVYSNHNKSMGVVTRVGINRGTPGVIPESSSLRNVPQTDFLVGLQYASRVKKQMFLASGLHYSIYGMGYSRDKETATLPLNANKETIRYRFTTLSIPLSFYYYTSEYRLRTFVKISGGLHFLINRKEFATYEINERAPLTESTSANNNFALLNPSMGLSFGWEYDWEQDLSVRIAPYVSASFLPGKVGGRILSFGLSFSTQFQQN
jgi:hypothetical protein